MQALNQFYIKSVVRKALEEDLRPRGDITTNILTTKDKIIQARIIAKQDGVIAVSYTHLTLPTTPYV